MSFKAYFTQSNDQVFSVTPSQGELLSEADNGTLIKIGFTPTSYGKTFQSHLIIHVIFCLSLLFVFLLLFNYDCFEKMFSMSKIFQTPTYQWKYLVKGISPEYVKPRGQSAIRESRVNPGGLRRSEKKRNFIIENTYIIKTAVSSPIKGANLVPMRYANMAWKLAISISKMLHFIKN